MLKTRPLAWIAMILATCLPITSWAKDIQARLVERAKATKTDSMLVWRDGRILVSYHSPSYNGRAIPVHSVTKSMMGLAIAFLLDEGRLPSVDIPVSSFFPEWQSDARSGITFRQILSHTSGLLTDEGTGEVGDAKDIVRLALDAYLIDPPGQRFVYNSKAVNLITGLIEKLKGKTADEYLAEKLFTPLGITNWTWKRDPSGHAYGNSGLSIDAEGLINIGRLILQRGVWHGRRLLSQEGIRKLLSPPTLSSDSPCHYLWWLTLAEDGEAATALAARGFMGQVLTIDFRHHIVAVRLKDESNALPDENPDFPDFEELVGQL